MSTMLQSFQGMISKSHAELQMAPNEKIYFSPQVVPDMLATTINLEGQEERKKLKELKDLPEMRNRLYKETDTVDDDIAFVESCRQYDSMLSEILSKIRDPVSTISSRPYAHIPMEVREEDGSVRLVPATALNATYSVSGNKRAAKHQNAIKMSKQLSAMIYQLSRVNPTTSKPKS